MFFHSWLICRVLFWIILLNIVEWAYLYCKNHLKRQESKSTYHRKPKGKVDCKEIESMQMESHRDMQIRAEGCAGVSQEERWQMVVMVVPAGEVRVRLQYQ